MKKQPAKKGQRIASRTAKFFGPVVCAGVDYITLTCRENKSYKLLSEWAAYRLQEEINRGHQMSHWFFRGFDGLTAGSVQMGSDGPTLLLRLSGAAAWEHWSYALSHASNVSRLDLQTTIRLVAAPTTFAEMCEAQAVQFERDHNQGRAIELRRNSKTGKTVYVGSPKSDRRLRIYDKGAESKLPEYAECWRGEVQFNNDLAKRMADQLVQWQWQGTFAEKVVYESMKRVGIAWPALLAKEVSLSSPARPPSPLDRKLSWVRSQVKPTVHRLLEVYPRSVILDALGLATDDKEVS